MGEARAIMAGIFVPEPAKWGRRGDDVLWRQLADAFAATPLPTSSDEARRLILAKVRELAGIDFGPQAADDPSVRRTPDYVYVEALNTGGMSGGQVALAGWRDTGLPMLVHRAGAWGRQRAKQTAGPAPLCHSA